jgi:RimJ/RimL family protein N-acetyltransferase
VAKRIRGGYFAERSQAIGLVRDGEIVAGVIYENWNQRSIMCHIAIEGRLTPVYLAAIFDYPFKVCEAEKIITPIASENLTSIKLVENMGFSEEARIKDAHPDGDIILFTLSRSACRFLGERYGKRIRPAP